MTPLDNELFEEPERRSITAVLPGKLGMFVVGGLAGAALALLFAPKPGRELRADIATAAGEGYKETLEAAGELKRKTGEYLHIAAETGGKVLDVASSRMSAVKEEVGGDMKEIGGILEAGKERLTRPSISAA